MPFQPKSLEQAKTRIKAARNIKIHVDEGVDSDFKLQTDIPKCTRQNPILDSGPTAPLATRLANCPIDIANRTLLATTYMRAGDIDMDQREIPRMNHKKRGVTFAQRRLEARTDSDTFFSSVKSIHDYSCVQLFAHSLTQFIWITNLRRKKDKHGAYQDYIKEVGTPNILLTDNVKSQTGKKWTETSQKNNTQQIMLAPDKQNQNASERKINDVKHRVDYTLFAYQAPIALWCYCMQYVVYCLNLTAWRRLNYRTSTEALTGLTPDISHLKFTFWQKAWYYEYNGKFPPSPWKPCRVIMFADHQGDQFTYKIWTVDKDDNWEDSRELTRDIVIPIISYHEPPAMSFITLQDYDQLQFETLSSRLKHNTTKMTGKHNRNRADDKDSRPGPMHRK